MSDLFSNENVYFRGSVSNLSEEERHIIRSRMVDATVSDILHIVVEKIEGTKRVTVWCTEVDSDSAFYDEWHSEFYILDDKRLEVDIQ